MRTYSQTYNTLDAFYHNAYAQKLRYIPPGVQYENENIDYKQLQDHHISLNAAAVVNFLELRL